MSYGKPPSKPKQNYKTWDENQTFNLQKSKDISKGVAEIMTSKESAIRLSVFAFRGLR